MNNFKELKVWQKSVDLSVAIYKLTDKFPQKEQYAISSQMNRGAVSIPSNIAEGAGRNTKKDFNYFLGIALGSSFELETQLIIANQLGYLSEDSLNKIISELNDIQKMIRGLQKANNC